MSGRCFNQIAEQLRPILRIVREEGHNLDDLMQTADAHNEREDADKAENARTVAFDAQVQRLVDRGGPDHARAREDMFRSWFAPLRPIFQDGDIVVVPANLISVARQAQMIKFNDKPTVNYIDPTKLRNADGITTPENPYLLRGVEDGEKMCGTSPYDCVEQFTKEGRATLALTVIEGINLVIQRPEVLSNHYVDCSGSRDTYGGCVPNLCTFFNIVELDWHEVTSARNRWGSASAKSRLS